MNYDFNKASDNELSGFNLRAAAIYLIATCNDDREFIQFMDILTAMQADPAPSRFRLSLAGRGVIDTHAVGSYELDDILPPYMLG